MNNKLRISAGGGIVSPQWQTPPTDCATIAIGLGGTGISCLRSLKKEIFTRVKPDSGSSYTATYRHIKFLAVDADRSSIDDTNSVDSLDSNVELFDISCPDIGELFKGEHLLQQDPSLQWLCTRSAVPHSRGFFPLSSTAANLLGNRQIGRLLLMLYCRKFVTKLTHMITEACIDLADNAAVNVHIFTGLGGSTGSGTFLDVCYIVQHVLDQLGLTGQACTHGYFFLPDVLTSRMHDISNYIKCNSFAALLELEHAMHYRQNGDRWEQVYENFSVTTQEPPVKCAYLITATDSDGTQRENSYDYAMHTAVECALASIIQPHNTVFDSYCIPHAASVYLPYNELSAYLVSGFFERFNSLLAQRPSTDDVELFATANHLKFEDLLHQLCDNLPGIPIPPFDSRELYDQTIGIPNDTIPSLFTPMRKAVAEMRGKMAENRTAMLDSDSAVCTRIKKALLKIAADPDKGPYYAGRMLHALDALDLNNIICGHILRTQEQLEWAYSDRKLSGEAMAKALERLQHAAIFNRNRRAQEYVTATHDYFERQFKIDRMQLFIGFLECLKKQFADLHENYFDILTKSMTALEHTFDDNLRTLTKQTDAKSSFKTPLMTVSELRSSLDTLIANTDINTVLRDFLISLLDECGERMLHDESAIAQTVAHFFLDRYQTEIETSITQYIHHQYSTTAPTALAEAMRDMLSTSHASHGGTVHTHHVHTPDRLTVFHLLSDIPLSAYSGIHDCQQAYVACAYTGRHLYEGTKNDPRDYRRLFDEYTQSATNA